MKQIFSLIAFIIGVVSLAAQSSSCFSLTLATESAAPGDTICLDVTVDEFTQIVSMQNSFEWDPTKLNLVDVDNFNLPNLSTLNFNLQPPMLASGQTVISWFDITNPNGVSLTDGAVIYSMCFEVLSTTSGEQLGVNFSGSPIPVEIVNGGTESLDLFTLINGGVVVNGSGNLLDIEEICLDAGSCGMDKSADLAVSGGQPNYLFNWVDENGITVSTSQDLNGVGNGTYMLEVTDANGMTASATCTIEGGNGLITTYDYVCTDDTANISVFVWSGGTPPYTFEWSNGVTMTDPSVSVIYGVEDQTDYSVTVTSSDGCTEIIDIPAFDCNPNPDFLVAHNYECTLFTDMPSVADLTVAVWTGGEPPYTFSWSTGEVTDQIDASTPISTITVPGNGIYYVTITDNQGNAHPYGPMVLDCEEASPLNATTDIECLQDTAQVTITATGGVPLYTYSWSTGFTETVSGSSIQLLGDGTYSVTITDATNVVVDIASIVVDCDQSEQGWLIAESIECELYPDTAVADIHVVVWSGGTLPYTYEWSTGETQTVSDPALPVGTITVDGNGTYDVTITDASGNSQVYGPIIPDCGQAQQDLKLFVEDADVAPNESFCIDLTVEDYTSLMSLSLSMHWDTSLIQLDSVVLHDALPNFSEAHMNLYYTDMGYFTMLWVEGNLEPISLPDGTAVLTMCFTASANTGITSVEITSDPTDIGAVTGDIEPVNIEVHNGIVNIGGVGIISEIECLADSAMVTVTATAGTGPYIYNWSNGYTETTAGASMQVLDDGIYEVSITDNEGNMVTSVIEVNCDQSGSGWLLAESVQCELYADTAIADISVIAWSGGTLPYTFSWSTGDTEIVTNPLQPYSTITVDGNGTYSVTITDANGVEEIYGPIIPDCGVADDTGIDLFVGDAEILANESFCVDVTVGDFNDIVSLQWSMNWDADTIHFDSLVLGNALPVFDTNNFNISNTDDGYLVMAWYNQSLEQLSLPDGTILFSLCFTASGDGGTTDVVISSTPISLEVFDGSEVLDVDIFNGMITVLPPEVWPGDTEANGSVSHFDLLNIGLAYGATGPIRPDATTEWIGQYAPEWGQTTPVSGVDFKHIDTNGDGFVDADDTLALTLNWGEESFFSSPQEEEIRSASGTVIYVQPDTLILGAENVFNIIMGQADTPAENIYGVAFTIVYDTAAVEPETAYASFLNSWLGSINEDMLTFYRDRYDEGRIDIAITRTDGLNITGEGIIGQLHITIQDVIFLRTGNYELLFDIENVRLIDYQENEIEIISQESVSVIKDAVTDTEEPATSSKVVVYPNPATNHLYLLTDEMVERVELMSVNGISIFRENNAREIDVQALPAGNYILKVWTDHGFSLQRVAIVK